jgi:hypothetical protein
MLTEQRNDSTSSCFIKITKHPAEPRDGSFVFCVPGGMPCRFRLDLRALDGEILQSGIENIGHSGLKNAQEETDRSGRADDFFFRLDISEMG